MRRQHEATMKPMKQVGVLVYLILSVLVQSGFAAGSGASDVVREFYQALLYNMRSGPRLGHQGRSAYLAPTVPRVFNIPYMTQLAVGPAWASVPETQRRQVMQAFERYVTAVYANRFDSYSGERLDVV